MKSNARPPIVEIFPVPELVADEVVAFAEIDGDLEITFARLRQAVGSEPARREITGRVILLRRFRRPGDVAVHQREPAKIFEWSAAVSGHA